MSARRLSAVLHRRLDWFLVGMAAAVGLAWLFPDPGADGGWMHPEVLTKAGVAVVFFLHGIGLPFAALKAGTLRWPLHLTVQACTFLLFPLMGIGLLALAGGHLPAGLRLGFFYLCALPSTVSSSVALTAAARGNVPAAVFNATLSALLGVLLTPLWLAANVAPGGAGVPLGPVVLDLIIWLVLPLVAGQLLRPWLGGWAARNKRFTQRVDRGTVLLLVYTSFCDSVKRGVWTGQGWETLAVAVAGSALLLTAALLATSAACRLLGFPEEDRIAAVFCGSKKTLASGVPMAALIFGASADTGLILVPIMIYHPLQLVVCGVLAGRWARREPEPEPREQSVTPDRSPQTGG
ncbi:bile acid:sodium symporter [Gemmata sp. JC673]|uniref:Bile acid:sodium symporter n=1 Tax=Gemmata algarum TaxID=2975278 RepID=A0ABU5EXX6_9BACT|nr:bile acid:sodium symporter family protein [Gemmata algarum]MDY3560152.1 bile acid:sodium symporter [Gemmata algarum]